MRPSISISYLRALRDFLAEARGASSIEYAILASCIAVAVVAVIVSTGTTLTGTYKLVLDAYPN